MIAFLFIGSGDVQPWAVKQSSGAAASEQAPLSGKIIHYQRLCIQRFFCYLLLGSHEISPAQS